MTWQSEVFNNFIIYGVTDLKTFEPSFIEKIDQAYAAGVDIIQLRSKCLSDHDLYKAGLEIKKMALNHRKLFFVNDRLDLALALKADGLHVGQEDLPVAVIRAILKNTKQNMFLGKSTHSLPQAKATLCEDVDYIGVGPIYKTPTKKDYVPVGLNLLDEVSRVANKPFVAIGGIDKSKISELKKAGGRRIAVVRALFESDNVFETATELRAALN